MLTTTKNIWWPIHENPRLQALPRVERFITAFAFMALACMPFTHIFARGASDILCTLIGAGFLYHCFRNRYWSWLREWPVRIGLLLWLYLVLVVTPLAVHPAWSLKQALPWLRIVLMFCGIVYWLSKYPEELKRVALFYLLAIQFVILDSILQFTTGTSMFGHPRPAMRLTGPFERMVVGIYLAKLIFPAMGILIYFALKEKMRDYLKVCIATLVLTYVMVFISGERTAFITMSAGIGIIGVLLAVYFKRLRKPMLAMMLAAAAGIAIIYFSQRTIAYRIALSFQMLGNFWESPYGQLFLAAKYLWLEHPITGTGLAHFDRLCPTLMDLKKVTYCNIHPHNPYMEWLSGAGMVGLIGFIAWIISLFSIPLRALKNSAIEIKILAAFALATFMPTFFPLVFTQSFFANWPALLAWFPISLILAALRGATRHE